MLLNLRCSRKPSSPVTRGGRIGGFAPPENFLPSLEKCVEHSLKNLGFSQKTLRPSWCPKLVTGLKPSKLKMEYTAGKSLFARLAEL